MKYLKLFEQDWDPFGEEKDINDLTDIDLRTELKLGDEIYNKKNEFVGVIDVIKNGILPHRDAFGNLRMTKGKLYKYTNGNNFNTVNIFMLNKYEYKYKRKLNEQIDELEELYGYKKEFDEWDPFGEEVSTSRSQWYDFGGYFYVLKDKLPMDNYIQFMLDGNHECIEYDFNIKDIKIKHDLANDYVYIALIGDLVVEGGKNRYEDKYIRDSLKQYITYQMKKLTQYDDLDLESFYLTVEKK